MVWNTKLMNIFYVLLIGFLTVRKCVTDVCDIVYDDVRDYISFAHVVNFI